MLIENKLPREMLSDLVSARLPDEVALQVLAKLTEEVVTLDLLTDLVSAIQEISPDSKVDRNQFGSESSPAIDCCGTGGSGLSHFNTSTATAFALSAQGVPVVKFGNRSASGQSGSFDFLEGLGIKFTDNREALYEIFDDTKAAFLFAPYFYPALGKLAPLRKKMGRKTILNFVGPLLNPAEPPFRLMGVSSKTLKDVIAQYLVRLKTCKKAFIVQSETGLDELDPNATNYDLKSEGFDYETEILRSTSEFDTPTTHLSLKDNISIFHQLTNDFDNAPSYFKRLIVLNTGMALYVAGKTASLTEGQAEARELFKSGAVATKYEELKKAHAKYS